MYTIKITRENLISKGGHVFETLPKNLERLSPREKNFRDWIAQSDKSD